MNPPRKSGYRNIFAVIAVVAIASIATVATLVHRSDRSTQSAPQSKASRPAIASAPQSASASSPASAGANTISPAANNATGSNTQAIPAGGQASAIHNYTASAGSANAHGSASDNKNGNPAQTPDSAAASLTPREQAILDKIPDARFRDEVLALDPGARFMVFKSLAAKPPPDADYASIHISSKGHLYYVCQFQKNDSGPDDDRASATAAEDSGAPAAASVPINQPPVRHSRPGSRNVLFLDFGGMDIKDTEWNVPRPSAPNAASIYRAKSYDTDGNPNTLNDQEQRDIIEIWERVAEDFSPFDVDVTTERPATFTRTIGHALITSATDKDVQLMPAASNTNVAGVAFTNVFAEYHYVTNYSPALIYYDRLGKLPAKIAYAVSHELGHNLGLSHDGFGPTTKNDDGSIEYGYYDGHGDNSAISWAPIMGAGYSRSVIQWSKGDYFNANNHEDDIAIIAGKLGYRGELGATTYATALPIIPLDSGHLGATGIIRNAAFSHYYAINLTDAGSIALVLDPLRTTGSNLIAGSTDLRLEIIDSAGNVTGTNAPANATDAGIVTSTLAPGTWYVRITSEGAGNPISYPPTGYTAYGSIGQYILATDLVYENPLPIAPISAIFDIREIPSGAGQSTIDIKTAGMWTATTTAPWLTLLPASGSGPATFAITHETNDTLAPRRATITISGDSGDRVIEIAQPAHIPLATALDNNLAWTTGGDANWIAQTIVTHDGQHAVRSGIIQGVQQPNQNPYLDTGQQTWLQTTVTGNGILSFWWKVSSEAEERDATGTWGDICYFYMDNQEQARISGTQGDWANRTFAISGTGTRILKWLYHKDPYLSVEADAAWLDQVTWTPGATILLNLTPAAKQVPADSGQFSLGVDANVAWTAATANAAWLTISPASGNGPATLTVSHATNTATTTRTATITLAGGGTTSTCVVTQAAATTTGTNSNNNGNTGGNNNSGGGGAPSLWSLLALALLLAARAVGNKR